MSRKAKEKQPLAEKQHLAEVDRRIEEEEERLRLQHQRIQEARVLGWPTEEHEVMLASMQNHLHAMRVQRRPLAEKLQRSK